MTRQERRSGFAMHYQHVWTERGGHLGLPLWLRVASLAYGAHKRNGHAVFQAGDLEVALGRPDPVTGEWKPLARQNVQRAIQTAIDYGMLAERSTARCLIVPRHAIEGGYAGNSDDACPIHDRTTATRKTRKRASLRVVGE